MKEKELAQEIEAMILIQVMEVEPEFLNQDVDPIPSTQQVTLQSSPPLTTEKAPSEGEEDFPLDDGVVMDMYNITYDELQKKIVQVRKKYFSRRFYISCIP